jgi:hypothetical protein
MAMLFRLAVRDRFRVIPKVLGEHHQFSASPRHINELIVVSIKRTISDGHGGTCGYSQGTSVSD